MPSAPLPSPLRRRPSRGRARARRGGGGRTGPDRDRWDHSVILGRRPTHIREPWIWKPSPLRSSKCFELNGRYYHQDPHRRTLGADPRGSNLRTRSPRLPTRRGRDPWGGNRRGGGDGSDPDALPPPRTRSPSRVVFDPISGWSATPRSVPGGSRGNPPGSDDPRRSPVSDV